MIHLSTEERQPLPPLPSFFSSGKTSPTHKAHAGLAHTGLTSAIKNRYFFILIYTTFSICPWSIVPPSLTFSHPSLPYSSRPSSILQSLYLPQPQIDHLFTPIPGLGGINGMKNIFQTYLFRAFQMRCFHWHHTIANDISPPTHLDIAPPCEILNPLPPSLASCCHLSPLCPIPLIPLSFHGDPGNSEVRNSLVF